MKEKLKSLLGVAAILAVGCANSMATTKGQKPVDVAKTPAPKVAAMFCRAWVLDQGMSRPLERASLKCGRGDTKTDMSELASNGWVKATQTAFPDGDQGGVAVTQYNLSFRRNSRLDRPNDNPDTKADTMSCKAWVISQDMSPPLSRTRFECANGKAYADDLFEKGWVPVRQSIRRDGEFGSAPQFEITTILQFEPK